MGYWDSIIKKGAEGYPVGPWNEGGVGTPDSAEMKEPDVEKPVDKGGVVVGNDVKIPGIDANGNIAPASKSGTELMNGAFGDAWNMSKEDTDKALRRMGAVNGARALSDSILAFANTVYAGNGAQSVEMPKNNMPSQMQFVDRVNQARKEAYERSLGEKRYEDALKEKEQARKDAEALKRYQIDANNEYRNNMLAYQMGKSDDANQLAQDKFDYQQTYNERRLDEQHRHNVAMENKPTSGSRGKSTKQFSGGGKMYSIPSNVDQARMEKEIVKDAIARGVIDPNNYVTDPRTGQPIKGSNGKPIINSKKPRKTDAEMVKEAQRKWDDGMEAVVGRYGGSAVMYNKTLSSTKTSSTKTQSGSSGGSSTVASGSTGSWGSSINRKKK